MIEGRCAAPDLIARLKAAPLTEMVSPFAGRVAEAEKAGTLVFGDVEGWPV